MSPVVAPSDLAPSGSFLDRSEPPKVAVSTASRRGIRGSLSSLALGAAVLAVVAVSGWNLSGGHLLVMETPSMCPSVCVGALVAERPLQGPVRLGELITFHPPGNVDETYTHEVSRVFANGTIQTRGIANPDHDPWLIRRSNIVGEVAFTVGELGWLFKALPMLAVGIVFWVLGRPWIGERFRRSWDRGWMSVLTALPLWLLHPLVRASVIASSPLVPHRKHWAMDSVVNTGILPASFRAAGGRTIELSSGAIGQVSGPLQTRGLLSLRQAVSMPWWGLAIMAIAVMSPLLGCLWHIFRGDEAPPLHLRQHVLSAPPTHERPPRGRFARLA